MGRALKIAASAVQVLLCVLMGAAWVDAQPAQAFIPPDVLYASDIPYSVATAAAGVVTLAVNLDDGGNIINVQVLRDIPTLTSGALVAVRGWTYAPASLNGKHVPSTLLVNVVFDPAYLQLKKVPLAPAEPFQPLDPKATPYAPPQLLAATYPLYPSDASVGSAVVLAANLDSGGALTKVTVIRAVPTLTTAASGSLKSWKFAAAVYANTPVATKVVVAMVFRKTAMPLQ
ncbi:MAG: energy transducer TonB [Candidatus Acidiferrales bacterium]|jgi:outer membrane biosynthesis protein TonB